ncbi:serine hydrolase domain-containing protein [Arthrobacter psychrolactophilus]
MRTLRHVKGGVACGLVAVLALAGCSAGPAEKPVNASPVTVSADSKLAAQVRGIIADEMSARHLRSVIVRVTIAGEPVVTEAYGESMPGVPATTEMHFRNGAVAISYMATALLQLVDEKQVSLTDKLSTWLPEVPNSDRVTLGQLAQMTSGYVDYVPDDEFQKQFYADPFRAWTQRSCTPSGRPSP